VVLEICSFFKRLYGYSTAVVGVFAGYKYVKLHCYLYKAYPVGKHGAIPDVDTVEVE